MRINFEYTYFDRIYIEGFLCFNWFLSVFSRISLSEQDLFRWKRVDMCGSNVHHFFFSFQKLKLARFRL